MPPQLKGSRILLREPREQDVAERLALGRSPEIARMLGASMEHAHSPLAENVVMQNFEKVRQNEHAWIIEYKSHFLGEIGLWDLKIRDRKARLAIGLYDPSKLGRGFGREAISLILTYGFRELHLNRIDLRVLAYNTRAIRCYKACGFEIEGIERESVCIDDVYHDDIIMGILASEFKAQVSAVKDKASS
jgi:RimJ/RimL family protein N-acetyltransferase